jgi:phosphoribosylamine--glycine ligase
MVKNTYYYRSLKTTNESEKGTPVSTPAAWVLYLTVPFVDEEPLMQKVEERIVKPTIEGIKKRGLGYRGFVFFGLIRVDGDPFVIEYNCRMGDPETEVVLPRLQSDLLVHLQELAQGSLGTTPVGI